MGHAVGAREVVHRVAGEAVALGRIGPHVGQETVLDPHDGAVGPEADPGLVALLAVVASGGQVLPSALHPPGRPAQGLGHRGHQHLLGVDGPLGAEAAPDVGHQHPHRLHRPIQGHRHRVPDQVGVLARRPHGEEAVGVRVGQDAPGLDGHPRQAGMPELGFHHDVGAGQGRDGVAHRPAHGDRDVVRPVRVERGSVQPGLRVGHRGPRLVVDDQAIQGVGQAVGIVGHHQRDRLSDVAGHVPGQEGLGVPAADPVGRPEGRADPAQVGGRPHGQRPRRCQGLGGVDAPDGRVGVGAAGEPHEAETVPPEVLHVTAAAGQEGLVFPAAGRGPDGAGGGGHSGDQVAEAGEGAAGAGPPAPRRYRVGISAPAT